MSDQEKIWEAYNSRGMQSPSNQPGILAYDDNKNSFSPKGGLPMNNPGASKMQYPSSDEEETNDGVVSHLEQAIELCSDPAIKNEIQQIISKLS